MVFLTDDQTQRIDAVLDGYRDSSDNESLSSGREGGRGSADTRPAPAGRPKRAKTEREASEIAGMVARMMVALARRAEGFDLEAMVALRDLELALAVSQKRAIRGLTQDGGYSYGEIALRLGMSRQGVRQRWGTGGE